MSEKMPQPAPEEDREASEKLRKMFAPEPKSYVVDPRGGVTFVKSTEDVAKLNQEEREAA